MNKFCFSRVIMVIIVALLGIMFLAPSTAFCASATEEQEAMVGYSKKIDVLNNLGCVITIYDGETSDLNFKKFMKEHGEILEKELIFNFYKVGWTKRWKYDILVGEGLKAEYANLIEYDQSKFSSRDEWIDYIKKEHVDMVYNDVESAIQTEIDIDKVNRQESFKEFKLTIANCLNNVWNLLKSGVKHAILIIRENPVILAIIVFVVLGRVLITALKKIVSWGLKMLWKLIRSVSNTLWNWIANFMKKCFTRKAKAN